RVPADLLVAAVPLVLLVALAREDADALARLGDVDGEERVVARRAVVGGEPAGSRQLRRGNLERDREEVEAGEDVLCLRQLPRAWNDDALAVDLHEARRLVARQVQDVEDPLLVEVVEIGRLPGPDAALFAAGTQRMDELRGERLVVAADFTAGGIAGIVAL